MGSPFRCAIPKHKAPAARVISTQQLALLVIIAREPGLDIYQLKERVAYANRSCVERAVQGLIKRGFIRWTNDVVAGTFKYNLTREGQQKLSSSNG